MNAIVVVWRVIDEPSARHDGLWLGKHSGHEVCRPLPEVEALVRLQDHSLNACLRLLRTCFPTGCDAYGSRRDGIPNVLRDTMTSFRLG